jgi:hypothetical protein
MYLFCNEHSKAAYPHGTSDDIVSAMYPLHADFVVGGEKKDYNLDVSVAQRKKASEALLAQEQEPKQLPKSNPKIKSAKSTPKPKMTEEEKAREVGRKCISSEAIDRDAKSVVDPEEEEDGNSETRVLAPEGDVVAFDAT